MCLLTQLVSIALAGTAVPSIDPSSFDMDTSVRHHSAPQGIWGTPLGTNCFSQHHLRSRRLALHTPSGLLPGRRSVKQSRQISWACSASEDDASRPAKDESTVSRILDVFPSLGEGVGSSFLLLLWAGVVAYALVWSPNQTPTRDAYFIQKLVGLQKDSFQISTLYVCLFNAMGIYPLIFLALLQPSGKSDNKVPLWPFTTASFGLGFLALGLYFALWKPTSVVASPPSKDQLEGLSNLSLKATESSITSVIILLTVLGLVGTAGVAAFDPKQWLSYFRLFDESRLVHVSTLDFGLLTTAAPFWMLNDAQKRRWDGRDYWVPILACLPLLGPAIYLLLRPKAN